MVSVEAAFTDAWRSYRIRQGDDPATLPNPLGGGHPRVRKRRRRGAAADGGGGFLADEGDGMGEEQPLPEHIPLSSIPDALASLSLPSNDDFVLDLFAQTATYVTTDTPKKRRTTGAEEGQEKMVSLHDFRRVAEVLRDDEDAPASISEDSGSDAAPTPSTSRPVRAAAASAKRQQRKRQAQAEEEEGEEGEDNVASEDAYSEQSGAEDDDDEGQAVEAEWKPARTVRKRNLASAGIAKRSASGGLRRAKRGKKSSSDDGDESDGDGEGHLTTHQRRLVHAAFQLFTAKLSAVKGEPLDDPARLSKEDIKLLVANVGEKIADKEVGGDAHLRVFGGWLTLYCTD